VAAEDYFTIFTVAFLAERFNSNSGAAGGSSSIFQWMAKRSLPIWMTIVEAKGSSGDVGNANTFFWRCS
jgi:hypothetical protein